jgi:hypothetical protein
MSQDNLSISCSINHKNYNIYNIFLDRMKFITLFKEANLVFLSELLTEPMAGGNSLTQKKPLN